MAVFGLPATCPRCAGALELTNSTASEDLSVAILSCAPCKRQWEVTARITPHNRPKAT